MGRWTTTEPARGTRDKSRDGARASGVEAGAMVPDRPNPSSTTPFPTTERPRPRLDGGSAAAPRAHDMRLFSGPAWSLRIEGQSLAVVLERAPLPGGAELVELVFRLPHVPLPFDFRDGIERFRHQRGVAEELGLRIDARIALDWIHRVTHGAIAGSAFDDAFVLVGRTETGTRYTVRARLIPDERDSETGEPLLQLSLYQIRVYGPVDVPWPVLAGRILDALPPELVVDRTLTTARLRVVRRALAWGLASLGWKVPDVHMLEARGVELREGRFVAWFSTGTHAHADVITMAGGAGDRFETVRSAFERFIEDLELKRHHGQIDRLIANQQVREALGEVYRAFDGAPRPGFLAERIIGICASQAILFDEGERICFDLLEKHPDYAQALCGLGAIAMARGRFEEGAAWFARLAGTLNGPGEREDATAADLAFADCLRVIAPGEARVALERVLERAPDHEEALSELIAIAEADNDTRAAMPLYKRLLFSARSHARTREAGLRLARFALERGEPDDARVLLRVVLEAAPDDLDAQMALADVEAEDGRGTEAVRILEGALRALPPQDTPRVTRVVVRLAHVFLDLLGDPARARSILWRTGDFARLQDATLRELAALAVRAQDPALALRFIELVPMTSTLWNDTQALRAEALIQRGDGAQALRSVLAVLAREPDHEHALRLLEETAPDPEKRQWLVGELLESAGRAAAGEPRARVLHRVAAMYVSLDLPWDAIAPLEHALTEAPESERFDERARLLMELQARFGLWADFLRTGAQRLPSLRRLGRTHDDPLRVRVELLVDLGRVALRELDDARTARGWLEEAVRLAPRQLEAHELLAESLAAMPDGESRRALAHVLMRLEAIRPEAATRDAARMQLAEIQLFHLQSPTLARATLQRVSVERRRDPLVLALEHRIAAGLDAQARGARETPAPLRSAPTVPVAPVATSVVTTAFVPPTPEPHSPAPPARPTSVAATSNQGHALFDAAVDAADQGRADRAVALLDILLQQQPSHGAARDLRALLVTMGHDSPPAAAPSAVVVATETALPPAPAPSMPQQGMDVPTPAHVMATASNEPAAEIPSGLATRQAEMDRIEGHLQAATAHFFEDRLVEARSELTALLAIDADVVPALELLNSVQEALGDTAGRVETLQRLIRSVFDVDAIARYNHALAESLDALGRNDDAVPAWCRYLRLQPFDQETFGRVRERLPVREQAEIFEAAVDAAEDAGHRLARCRALLDAAETHGRAEDNDAARYALSRIALEEAGNDPELLLRIFDLAVRFGVKPLSRIAADDLIPLLLPGPDRDAVVTWRAGPGADVDATSRRPDA
jgi:tetratricopeptide (TPR) repeat protein